MPLSPNIQSVVTRMATEFKTLRAVIGSLTSLNTTSKTSLVSAINELQAGQAQAGAQINDVTPGTGTVYSSSKTEAHVAQKIADLVSGSPALLDTLDEIANALGDDPNFATTINTALGNRVRYDAAQTLTGPQQAQARTNIGAGVSNLAVGPAATDAKAGNWREADATTGANGLIRLAGMLGGTAASPTVRSATEAVTGAVELATTTETSALTDSVRAITPASLKPLADSKASTASVGDTEVNLVTLFESGLV